MKVNEIIAEDRLDEALPVIGGIGLAGALTLISAALAGWSIFEIVQKTSEYADDPNSLTDDDWGELFLDIALLVVPGFLKLGRAALVRLMPRSVLRWCGGWLRKRVLDRLAKERKTNKADYDKAMSKGPNPQKASELKKKLNARNAKAAARAKETVDKFPDKVLSFINYGIGTAIAYDYWKKIHELEDDWERYMAGDRTTENFGDEPDQSKAYHQAQEKRKRYLGELTVGIGAAVAALPAAKAVGALGKVFGAVTTGVTGSTLAGGFVKLTADAAAKLIKYAGPGLALFLQTDTGRKFLQNSFVDAIVSGAGTITSATLKLAYDAIDELAKMVGIDNATAGLRSKIKDPNQDPLKSDPGLLDKTPSSMKVQKDPSNPKIIYIGGVQVTDADGYQAIGNSYLQSIKDDARALKMPDPTAGIPKKPGKVY